MKNKRKFIMFFILLMFLILLFICGCDTKNNKEHSVIDCDKKDELLKNGAILIDVRTEEEFATSHLEDSINIPVDEILDGVMNLGIKKEDSIIVYCNSGNRSIGGYRELKNNGYKNVYDLGSISKCEK